MVKSFHFRWIPTETFFEFSQLKSDEIGVLVQVINLIMINNGAIRLDYEHIGRSCNNQRAKVERVINKLINKGFLSINKEGKLEHESTLEQIKEVQNKREEASKNGKKGAEIRHGIVKNQDINNSQAKVNDLANTSTSSIQETKPNTSVGEGSAWQEADVDSSEPIIQTSFYCRHYNVELWISDSDRKKAKEAAPGHDLYGLMQCYNEWINSYKLEHPRHHGVAFIQWCKKYTKGKPPS